MRMDTWRRMHAYKTPSACCRCSLEQTICRRMPRGHWNLAGQSHGAGHQLTELPTVFWRLLPLESTHPWPDARVDQWGGLQIRLSRVRIPLRPVACPPPRSRPAPRLLQPRGSTNIPPTHRVLSHFAAHHSAAQTHLARPWLPGGTGAVGALGKYPRKRRAARASPPSRNLRQMSRLMVTQKIIIANILQKAYHL